MDEEINKEIVDVLHKPLKQKIKKAPKINASLSIPLEEWEYIRELVDPNEPALCNMSQTIGRIIKMTRTRNTTLKEFIVGKFD